MTQPTTMRLAAPPDTLDDDPLITSVMSHDVVAIDAEARLPTALHVMATTGVRHLPVVDRGRCLGVLVETDLIRSLTEKSSFDTGLTAVVWQLSAPRRSCRRPHECPTPLDASPPTYPTRSWSPTTVASWASSPPRTSSTCSPAATRGTRNAMTGRIVLAIAPGTAERAVDTAFALAAERGSSLLAVRTWHDPDLPLGGWLRPDRTARWEPPTRRLGASSIAR